MKRLILTAALSIFAFALPAFAQEKAATETKSPAKAALDKAKEAGKKAAGEAKEAGKEATSKVKEATDKKPAKEEAKPADKEAKPAAKKTAPRSKQKPEELSDSDKALLAGAKKKVDALTAAQKTKLMDYANTADIKTLSTVDNVGEVKAKAIIAERPFATGEALIMVEGVGEGTFDNILATVTGTAKKAEPKKEAPKKEEPKAPKKETKKTK